MGVAAERRTGRMTRGGPRVVVLAYPGADLLDVAGPCAVFDAFAGAPGRPEADTTPGYRIEVVSTGGGSRVETSCGVALVAERDYRSVRGRVDTLLVAGGDGAWRAARDEQLLRWLRRMAPRVRRIGSVCTGAFVLAAAGLLDGRRATTHWQVCPRLARDHPAVAVEEDPIFVRDGNVYTSAGVTAGMDMALALVEEDHGHDAAMRIARYLVMFVRRPGGQSQFSAALDLQAAERRPIRDLQTWISGHPSEDLSVSALAARAHMSPRNFARVFREEVGQTPARFVERVRVEAARRFLEEGVEADVLGDGLGEIAEEDRASVLAAYPRVDFKEGIVRAFADGFGYRPETAFGTMNTDILERTQPGYRRPNFCDPIAANPLAG